MSTRSSFYPILRLISFGYGIFGFVTIAGGVVGFVLAQNALHAASYDVILATSTDASLQQLSTAMYWYSFGAIPWAFLFGGIMLGMSMLLASGLIKVLVDIAQSTHATESLLRYQLVKKTTRSAQPHDPARLPRLGQDFTEQRAVEDWQRPAVPRPDKWQMPKS